MLLEYIAFSYFSVEKIYLYIFLHEQKSNIQYLI